MFECPDCGGVVQTSSDSHFCVSCTWFESRRCQALDNIEGLHYPEAGSIPEFSAA
jgi:endogenous inhibitor of DNA gyrase (YacG/DUF329 family)